MSSFLEFASKYEIVKNEAVEAFLSALEKQIDAIDDEVFNRRSWVKKDGNGYRVKLGKLKKEYYLQGLPEVTEFLNKAASAAREDAEFTALIEAAYGGGLAVEEEPKPRRGRKPKNA